MKNLFKYVFMLLAVAMGAVAISSCSKDDDSSSFPNQTLTYGKTYTIANGADVTWTSSNALIASVSGNVVTANCVGTATITSSKGSFTVTVNPVYNNVTLPSMNFGSSMSTIKSEMSSYTLAASTTTALLYNANSPLKYYMYGFENSAMKYSSMLCTYANFETVANYVKERYAIVGTNTSSSGSTYAGGISPDKSVMVVVSYEKLNGTYYYYFAFAKYTASSSARAVSRSIDTEIDYSAFDDILKNSESLPTEALNYLMK